MDCIILELQDYGFSKSYVKTENTISHFISWHPNRKQKYDSNKFSQ